MTNSGSKRTKNQPASSKRRAPTRCPVFLASPLPYKTYVQPYPFPFYHTLYASSRQSCKYCPHTTLATCDPLVLLDRPHGIRIIVVIIVEEEIIRTKARCLGIPSLSLFSNGRPRMGTTASARWYVRYSSSIPTYQSLMWKAAGCVRKLGLDIRRQRP